ncbi:TonB-dependent receptor [Luteimonas deserti]|uniref:TonB-dependent receptor n=1 Tax=Luteimonas deserti TaxID=2752306 RepID=A0A7Z0U0A3_9GAMM|nr:TonB-dependent receptor [Luteimonas deserti]NYZ63068.1 TonB-dependent receptor [Luteimonas deserti]
MTYALLRSRSTSRSLLSVALAGCLALAAPAALAQSTAATIRGQVMADSAPAAGARVTAINTATGLSRSVTVGANGAYNLAGLPPGTYRIQVEANGQSSSQNVVLAVGQTATLNLGVGGMAESAPAGEATDLDAVRVTAAALVETRTSEIATYVSQRQIEALPQSSRNFLAFADTVPGMVFVNSPNGSESQLRSGAQGANNINVFIDGVGQKNYVTPGGITGQDDSRGNPFPQSAIGEYKVITSNYKAEYDQISSAAVTAVTRSGTNDFSGSFFWDRTSDEWRAATLQEQAAGEKSPEVTEQYGATIGGPIIRDVLHFFVAYEAKDFVVPQFVRPPAVFDASGLPGDLRSFYGPTSSPFRQDIYFAKLSFQPGESHLVELSTRVRDESSLSGIGGINTPGFGTDLINDETRVDLRYQFSSTNWLNDAHITFEDTSYNPVPITASPGFRYTIVDPNNPANLTLGVLNLGGGPNFQDKGQKGLGFQNDLTFFGFEGHTIKMGVKYKDVELRAFQQSPPFPQYFFDVNESLAQPYRIEYTTPRTGRQPFVQSDNTQFGIYIQDDWEVNDRLTLNLGLRWDYEKSPSYLDYRVNDDLAAALRGWTNIQNTDYDIEDFISSGSNRKAFKGAWQPRVGFSYDLNADQRHVIFGGAGRAYDRNLFDIMAREFYGGAFTTYQLNFPTALHPCAGNNCLSFDPALLTPEGLAAYAAANPVSGGEINLINNDLKTPYSDQFSLGMRNVVTLGEHDWNTSVTLAHIRSRDGIYFRLGNRYPDGSFHQNPGATYGGAPFNQPIPGYGSLILGDNGINYNLNSLLVSVDKPFTRDSGWGINLAYTYSDAEENRPDASNGETYVFDFPRVGTEYFISTGIPRHRLVLSGIYDLGWDVTFSSKLVLSTHRPREATNCNAVSSRDFCFYDPFIPDGSIGFKQFDMALEKVFDTGTDLSFRVRGDLLNAFNWRNYNQFEGFRGDPGDPQRENFAGRNGNEILLPTRTFKLTFGINW